MVGSHQTGTVKTKDVETELVNAMIGDAKRNLLGIHQMISKKYYHNNLDEFCYKVTRIFLGDKLFDRLLFASATNNCKD